MQKITPFLWFDGQAEQAIKFYTSIFKNSRIVEIRRHGSKVMSGTFLLHGQEFIAFNGGPHFKFTPAISLFVDCKSQAEVDDLWKKLSAGGSRKRCGWLQDKFGLSWQIIPSILGGLLQHHDSATSDAAWKAMLQMDKINIKTLQRATRAAKPPAKPERRHPAAS